MLSGGQVEQELGEVARKSGISPMSVGPFLQELRMVDEQLAAYQNPTRWLQEWAASSPSPYVDPQHHSILKSVKGWLDAGIQDNKELGEAMYELADRITLSTLPMGGMDAICIEVPPTNEHLIVFDPIFFDVIYTFSNVFARAFDLTKTALLATRYGLDENLELSMPLLASVMNNNDSGVVDICSRTLFSLVIRGHAPQPFPFPPDCFLLAEQLRNMCAIFVAAHEYAHILCEHPPEGINVRGEELEADRLACRLTHAAGAVLGVPMGVRFLGVHFYFLVHILIEWTKRSAEQGTPQSLFTELEELTALLSTGPSSAASGFHPEDFVRFSLVDQWLQMRYPRKERREAHFFRSLLLAATYGIWECVQPVFVRAHSMNMRPDSHGAQSDLDCGGCGRSPSGSIRLFGSARS